MSNLATITNNILADSGIDDINVIVSTGSYADPSWITSLAWTKITGAPSNIVTGTGSAGQVAYWSSSSAITGESNLFWDATNDRLGINVNTPQDRLDVNGSIRFRLNTPNFLAVPDSGVIDFVPSTTDARLRIAAIGNSTVAASIDFFTGGLDFGVRLRISSTGTVAINNLGGSGTRMVVADANGLLSTQAIGSGAITGTGTTNTVPKFTGSTSIGNSQIIDNGTTVGIGVNPTTNKLEVGGGITVGTGVTGNTDIRFNNATNGKIQYVFSDSITGELGLESGAGVGIKFNTNGANTKVIITSGGNVLIGNPPAADNGARLQVSGTATFSSTVQTGGNVRVPAGSGLAWVGDASRIMTPEDNVQGAKIATPGGFLVEASVFKFIGGNVGIGTPSPNTILDVNGTINVRTNGFEFGRITTNNITGNLGGLTFQYNASGTFTNGIVLNHIGNVGIGTPSPATKLHIASTIENIVTNEVLSGGQYALYRLKNSNYTVDLGLDNTGLYLDGAGGATRFFNGGGSPRMTITSGGNVLIGTTADTGNDRRLQVAGNLFVDDNSTTGNGVQLKNADRPLITRGWDAFTSGNKTGVGRWGVYMEVAELFLGSPGTDYSGGLVSIGGWLINGTRQPNLTVNNQTRNVSITSLTGSGNRIVVANSGGTLISAVIGSGLAFDGTTLTATGGSSGSISGSGTSGTIALFTGATSIGNSLIAQSGSFIGIDTSGFTINNNLSLGRVFGFVQDINSGYIQANMANSGTYIVSQFAVRMHLDSAMGEITFLNAPSGTAGSGITLTPRLRIASSGNVLIGTTSDNGEKLQVNGRSFFNADLFTVDNGGIFFSGFNSFQIGIFKNANGLNLQTGGTPRLTITPLGGASFTGNVSAPGFFESSDASLKTLISDNYQVKGIESVVSKLYIKNGKQELGYFAQDLQDVLPSAVSKGSDGLLNLSYREVHTAKIAYLEERIKQLEKKYENN